MFTTLYYPNVGFNNFIIFLAPFEAITIGIRDVLGEIVTVIANRHNDPSSNPGRGCLYFK